MASLYRPRLTRYLDAKGARVRARDAKDSKGRVRPGIRRKVERAKKWYGKYRDHNHDLRRVPLCSAKSAAQSMLNELVTKAERRRAGHVDPFDEHRRIPLAEHLNKEFGCDGLIPVDKETMQVTGRVGVFAGGDIVRGAGTVVEAVADGRRAAMAIDAWLQSD